MTLVQSYESVFSEIQSRPSFGPFAQYSVVSLGWNLPNSSDAPNSLGVRWIQVAFLLFALIVPVVHIFIMLALVR